MSYYLNISVLSGYIEIITTGICMCLGYILKNIVPGDGINRFIPLIMGLTGVALTLWVRGFAVSPETILGGLLSGLASTGMYEMFSQFIRGDK